MDDVLQWEKKVMRVIYFYKKWVFKDLPITPEPYGRKPVALFGWYSTSATIDVQGEFIVASNKLENYSGYVFNPAKLPNSDHHVVLSANGNVFISFIVIGDEITFTEVKELKGIKIINISGTWMHCFAVSDSGQVYENDSISLY